MQDELRPLVEFPDVEQVYESKELWQFFVLRIPSSEQAEVEEILKREHIEEDDAVSLLKRFGERTIATHFDLKQHKALCRLSSLIQCGFRWARLTPSLLPSIQLPS